MTKQDLIRNLQAAGYHRAADQVSHSHSVEEIRDLRARMLRDAMMVPATMVRRYLDDQD